MGAITDAATHENKPLSHNHKIFTIKLRPLTGPHLDFVITEHTSPLGWEWTDAPDSERWCCVPPVPLATVVGVGFSFDTAFSAPAVAILLSFFILPYSTIPPKLFFASPCSHFVYGKTEARFKRPLCDYTPALVLRVSKEPLFLFTPSAGSPESPQQGARMTPHARRSSPLLQTPLLPLLPNVLFLTL